MRDAWRLAQVSAICCAGLLCFLWVSGAFDAVHATDERWNTIVRDSTSRTAVTFKENDGGPLTMDSVTVIIQRNGMYHIIRNRRKAPPLSVALWSLIRVEKEGEE